MRKGRVPSTHPLYRGLQVEKALALQRGERKRGGVGDGKGVVKGGVKRRSKAEWKEGAERVKIVEGRDAAAS